MTKKKVVSKKAEKPKKGEKRWSSGSKRSCSNCGESDHNIRTCTEPKKATVAAKSKKSKKSK